MNFKDWSGSIDVAVGALYDDETWQAASTGQERRE